MKKQAFSRDKHLLMLLLGAALLFGACNRTLQPNTAFNTAQTPPAPDYARLDNWAAHPDKTDLADLVPKTAPAGTAQADTKADVFFLHPTTLTGDKKTANRRAWNADVADTKLNKKTDESTIQFQASIFNSAGKIYAPRYRQAHFHSFFVKEDEAKSAKAAMDLAYTDVKTAFEYYLSHWNNGRPIIIASHSQGAAHAKRLLKEYFEGKELGKRLVVAYIVGWPVKQDDFAMLKPCETPEETGCYCTWRTYKRSFVLDEKNQKFYQPDVVVTNPILWTTKTGEYAEKKANKGAVLLNFNKIMPECTDAEVCCGYLMCTKPKFRGSFLMRTPNFHPGDMNLYYLNIRENVVERTDAFLKKQAVH